MVPAGGKYYSVFPLGAVLVNVPAAILRRVHLVQSWPARSLAAAIAGLCVFFSFRLSHLAEITSARRVLLALFPVFGTWTWCNLGFGGAWQVALGFALAGQLACLDYTLLRRRPWLAGFWFAVAFGNRTELLATLPVYAYFWLTQPTKENDPESALIGPISRRKLIDLGRFLAIPALLLLCTAAYNWARFGSPIDFGYARIPGILKEPWYLHGLFSVSSIRWNAFEMLFRGMGDIGDFPYLRPYGFGCSIFFATPFLFLLFREGGKHRFLCWTVIGALTLILWSHGNAGGWQFSYRYAMILIPWMFILLTENGPSRLTATETTLFIISVLLNGMAVYEFLWTTMIHVS